MKPRGLASTANLFNSVAIQPNGDIVAAGSTEPLRGVMGRFFVYGSGGDAILDRFTPAGVLDKAFGTSGIAKFDFPGATGSGCADVKLAYDGRIVVAGQAQIGPLDDDSVLPFSTLTAVARLTAAGKLDTTFNHTGTYVVNDGGAASGLAVQADGKVLLAGSLFLNANGTQPVAVERFQADGTLDPTFQRITGQSIEDESAVAVGPGGKIIVGGGAQPGDSELAAAARYLGDTGSIRGTVFNDADGNRKHFGPNEPGLAGRIVYIDTNDNGKLDASEPRTATDALGHYTFLGVDPGSEILVRQVLPAGSRQTTPDHNFAQHVTMVAGQISDHVDFGSTDHALVAGHLLSASGVPLSNVRVWVDDDGDGIFQSGEESIITDQWGYFTFRDLKAGTHRIVDSIGGAVSVSLGSGQSETTVVPHD